MLKKKLLLKKKLTVPAKPVVPPPPPKAVIPPKPAPVVERPAPPPVRVMIPPIPTEGEEELTALCRERGLRFAWVQSDGAKKLMLLIGHVSTFETQKGNLDDCYRLAAEHVRKLKPGTL